MTITEVKLSYCIEKYCKLRTNVLNNSDVTLVRVETSDEVAVKADECDGERDVKLCDSVRQRENFSSGISGVSEVFEGKGSSGGGEGDMVSPSFSGPTIFFCFTW